MQPVLAQPPARPSPKPRQRGFDPLRVGRIFAEGVLVADGLRPVSSPISVSNQPPASSPRDLPASASPHLPKRSSRNASSSRARSPTLRMPSCVQVLLRHLADARHFAHVERREKRASWPGITHSTPFGLAWSD